MPTIRQSLDPKKSSQEERNCSNTAMEESQEANNCGSCTTSLEFKDWLRFKSHKKQHQEIRDWHRFCGRSFFVDGEKWTFQWLGHFESQIDGCFDDIKTAITCRGIFRESVKFFRYFGDTISEWEQGKSSSCSLAGYLFISLDICSVCSWTLHSAVAKW